MPSAPPRAVHEVASLSRISVARTRTETSHTLAAATIGIWTTLFSRFTLISPACRVGPPVSVRGVTVASLSASASQVAEPSLRSETSTATVTSQKHRVVVHLGHSDRGAEKGRGRTARHPRAQPRAARAAAVAAPPEAARGGRARAPRRGAGAGAERAARRAVGATRGLPARGAGPVDRGPSRGARVADEGDSPPRDGPGLAGAAAPRAAAPGARVRGQRVPPEPRGRGRRSRPQGRSASARGDTAHPRGAGAAARRALAGPRRRLARCGGPLLRSPRLSAA